MAFPERIGRVTLATVPKVARTCKLYADRNGSALVAIAQVIEKLRQKNERL